MHAHAKIKSLARLPSVVEHVARGLLGRPRDQHDDSAGPTSRRRRSPLGGYLSRAADFCLACGTSYTPRDTAVAYWQRIEKT